MNFKFGQYIQRVHPNKCPLKFLERRERGHIQGLPNFWVPPIISFSGTGKAKDFKFGWTIKRVHPNKSPLKILENGVWAYPWTAQFCRVPPIISGMGKATDFKFGQYIQRVHPNKSPLKILEKREWANPGTAQFSQAWVKLRTSNFACTFIRSIGTKAH